MTVAPSIERQKNFYISRLSGNEVKCIFLSHLYDPFVSSIFECCMLIFILRIVLLLNMNVAQSHYIPFICSGTKSNLDVIYSN